MKDVSKNRIRRQPAHVNVHAVTHRRVGVGRQRPGNAAAEALALVRVVRAAYSKQNSWTNHSHVAKQIINEPINVRQSSLLKAKFMDEP